MKRIISLLIAVALVASIAGCSSNKKENAPDSSAAVSTANNQAEAPKEVKLSLGLPGGYSVTSQKIVDGFKAKYPEIKLEIDESPWGDFVKKITTQIAGGNPPDIWFQENAVILGYGKNGVAEDLSQYIEKDINKDDYISALFAAKDSNGKVWGVPHGLNPVALVYSKKLFDEAKIPYPTDDWTYQDMIDAAQKLTKDTDGDGKTDVYGFISGYNITQGWYPWIKSTGGQLLDSTFTKAMFDDPKTIEGLTKWADFNNKLKASAPKAFTDANENESKAFANGKGAMYFLQYSVAASINTDFPNLEYDVVKMPKGFDGKRVVQYVTNDWLIYSKAKQEAKDAAWTWIKYYLGDESQDIVADNQAAVPIKKSSQQRLEKSTTKPLNKKAFTDGLTEAGTTMDESPTWNQWRGVAQPIFADIYEGKISPQDGAMQVQEKVQKVLDENN